MGTGSSAVLRARNGGSWSEYYGAIDDAIIEKLKDDDDVRVRLQVGRAEHDHDYPVGNAAAVVSFVEHDDDFDAWAKQAKVPASGQGGEFV